MTARTETASAEVFRWLQDRLPPNGSLQLSELDVPLANP